MKYTVLLSAALILSVSAGTALAEGNKGEALFKEKCAACHPGGGNVMKPKASLKGLKDTRKIVQKIRSGGGGMTAFDQKAISDADARAVADYIVKTFKK